MVVRAVLAIENTGVIPLPPAKATTSVSPGGRQKTPAGQVVSMTSPGPSASIIQFDTTPPATRFTVTWNSSSTSGDDDIE